MSDIANTWRAWSKTAASNQPTDATTIGSGLDDILRDLQAVPRQFLASIGTAIASAATTDLSTMDGYAASLTGNVTITGFGTESAGIQYELIAASNPIIVHGAAAINCPGATNLQLTAGDRIKVLSEGSGIWRITNHQANLTSATTGTGSIVRAVSPALTGTPTAPTAATATATTQIATTEFIQNIPPPVTRFYTATGSTGWAKPTGLKYITVECWGGGGGGGTANSSGGTSSGGGNGGSGGYTKKTIAAASLGSSVTVTVGAAGGSATSGGLSAFQAHCTATGGTAGAAGVADTTGAHGAAGSGVNGDINLTGFTGSRNWAILGIGVGGITSAGGNATGGSAVGYSAGGGGAGDTSGAGQSGGPGAPGCVILTEHFV